MALVQAKPLNEFGGWLKFFYVTCWINVVVLCVVLPVFFIALFGESGLPGLSEDLSMLADAAVSIFFIRKILKVVKDPSADTPARIKGWLKIMLGLAFAFLAIDLSVALWKHAWAWSKDAEDVLRGAKSEIGWPALWLAYFQQAKRVKAYYTGAPAAPAAAVAPPSVSSTGPAPLEPS